MILSTCNRVEVIARPKEGDSNLLAFVGEYFHLDTAPLTPHLYQYRERDVIRHLFRVASSLDSMVVGEPQILGQVKESYAAARSVGAANAQLDILLQRVHLPSPRRYARKQPLAHHRFRLPPWPLIWQARFLGSLAGQDRLRLSGWCRQDERTCRTASALKRSR